MNKIKTLNELKDSKLLYEKDVPFFGYFLIVVLIFMMVAVTIWGMKTTKPYIVKGIGKVESYNRNYIMTPFTGEISGFCLEEGDRITQGDELFVVKSTDTNVQGSQINNQQKIYAKQINQYSKLIQSIKDNKNYFSSSKAGDSLFYNRFEEYKSQVKQETFDAKSYADYGYTEDQIREEIKKSNNKKSELYYAAIREAETSREQIQTELNILKSQAEALRTGAEDYIIKANVSGTVHMLGDYKDGMVAQTASPIASISTENDRFYINANIAAADRSRIDVGNKVDIEISGLQQNIYGTIKGRVSEIDSDVSTTEDGNAYFKIKVEPEKYYLMNKDGNRVNLSTGLQAEVRITYDEITYAKYLLDALGVKD